MKKLTEASNNFQNDKELKTSISSGRFDKEKYGLSHSIIIGDNGGLYALINNANKIEMEMLTNISSEEFLQDKIKVR